MQTQKTNLEGIVESPAVRILFLRGSTASQKKTYDPSVFLQHRGELSIPPSPLDALLEILYLNPDVVIADNDYTADFSTEVKNQNSLVSVLIDEAAGEPSRELGQFNGADFLKLAANRQSRAILSCNENRAPSALRVIREQYKIAREQIVYIPRGRNSSAPQSRTFKDAVGGILEEALEAKKRAVPHTVAFKELPNNFYLFLGAPSAGKTRTTDHILKGGKAGFNFWQIPKLTTRAPRLTDKKGHDTYSANRAFFEKYKDLIVTWDMFGERYGIPLRLSKERLRRTNILLGTVSGDMVKSLSDPENLNGKVIPVLLYPPKDFVKDRIRNDPDKRHRLPEIDPLYESYDRLIREGAIKYVIHFNPYDIHLFDDEAPQLTGRDNLAKILEEQLDEAIDSIVMRRVDAILEAERELGKPTANGTQATPHSPQDFYNAWVNLFVSTLFPGIASFDDLERKVNDEKRTVTLFPTDDDTAVKQYAKHLEKTPLSGLTDDQLKKIAPRTVVAVGRSYGMAYILLNPALLKYGWGSESEVVRNLLYQSAMPRFPTTIRTRESEPFDKESGFAYITSPDGGTQQFSDIYQWRLTDHDVDNYTLDAKDWPLRGISIGFSRTPNVVPVAAQRHQELREMNYKTVVYRTRSDEIANGSTPLQGSPIIRPESAPKTQEPPVQQ